MHITESDNMYHIDQNFYMSKIEHVPSEAEFSKFAAHENETRMPSKKRPDIVLEICQIAQITRAIYEKDIIKH